MAYQKTQYFLQEREGSCYTFRAVLETLESCNAVSCAFDEYERNWKDAIYFCSEQHEKKPMGKFVKCQNSTHLFLLTLFHLLAGIIKGGLKCSELFQDVVNFLMHPGALFNIYIIPKASF